MTDPEPRPSRKRRWGAPPRWPAKLLLVLSLLGLCGALIVYWAYRNRNDERLASYLAEKLNPHIRGRMKIGRVHWSPRAVVDIALGASHPLEVEHFYTFDPAGREVLYVRRATARMDLLALLTRGEIRIHDGRVEGVRCAIVEGKQPDGGAEVGLVAAFSARVRKPGRGPRIRIRNVRIDRGQLVLGFPSWRLRLHDFALREAHYGWNGGPSAKEGMIFGSQVRAPRGVLEVAGRKVPLTEVQVAHFDTSEAQPMEAMIDLQAQVRGSPLRVTGRMIQFFGQHPRIDLGFNSQRGKGVLAEVSGQAVEGRSAFGLRMRGPILRPVIEGWIAEAELGRGPTALARLGGRFRFRTDRPMLDLQHVHGTFLEGQVSGRAQMNFVDRRWDGELRLAGVAPAPLHAALGGKMEGVLRLQGQTAPLFSAAANVNVHWDRGGQLRDAWPRHLQVRGRTHLTPTILDLAGMTVSAEGNSLHARGSVSLVQRRVNLQLGIDLPALGSSLARRRRAAAVESLTGALHVTGRWPRLAAQGSVSAKRVGYRGLRFPLVSSAVEVSRGVVHLRKLRADGLGGEIRGAASLALFTPELRWQRAPTVEGHLQVVGLDLGTLGLPRRVQGRGNADLQLSGPLGQPKGVATIQLPVATVDGQSYRNVRLRLGLLPDRVSVYEGRLPRADGGTLSVWGDLHFDGALDLRVSAQNFPVRGIPGVPELPVPLAGRINGKVELSGTVEDPRLAGTVHLEDARVRRMPLGSGALTLAPGSDTIRVTGRFFGGLLRLDGYVMMRGQRSLNLTLDVQRFPIERLAEEIRTLGDVRGTASGRVRLRADAERGLTEADARFSELRLGMRYRPPGLYTVRTVQLSNRDDVVLRYRDGLLKVTDAQLVSSVPGRAVHDAEFVLGGWLSTRQADLRLRGRLTLKLAEFFLARRVRWVSGDARADLRLSGPWQAVKLEGALELAKVLVRLPKFDPRIEVPYARVQLVPGALRVPVIRLSVGGQELAAQGQLNLDRFRPTTVEASVAGAVNVELLELFFPEQFTRAAGVVKVNARLAGPLADPRVVGSLRVERVELSPRGWGRTLTLNRGHVALQNHLLYAVRPLHGTYDEGSIRIGGEVRLDRWEPVDIYLELVGSGIPQRKPKTYLAEANLNVRLLGDARSLELRGDVDLVDGRYIREFDIVRQAFLRPRTFEEEHPFWKGNSLLTNLGLQLRVRATGQLLVTNRYGKLGMTGALSVSGTLSEPRLEGIVRMEEGKFRIPFLRGEYTLERGEIVFDKNADPDHAEANLVAETQHEDRNGSVYQIKLMLRGPLTQMRMSLASVPTLDQGQILALLTLGRTTEQFRQELTTGQQRGSGAVGAADAQLKEFSGQFLSSILEDPIKQVTGLDLARLEVGTESVQVKGCKKFGRYVDVCGEYEKGLAGQSRVEGRAEGRIHDYLRLIGKAERLSTRIDTLGEENPSRVRLELKFRLPLR
ncbi:MAG: translocation/assembly module TamB domain-containing protein [Deltaproteobacteria bacterium]|nr:translocation/assembly module TamB domain-containing protein [Deltaproteobacteria bacterium]